jgi:hypothetical protein
MKAQHLEVLVEEPSMEAFLAGLLPRLLSGQATFAIHVHQGKSDLLAKLGGRLRGYSKWLPDFARIVILVDRDDDNCAALKNQMEQAAAAADLVSRTVSGGADWQVLNRIAIEELESWFFGEWTAVRKVYPKVSAGIPNKSAFRQPDAIAGGSWEALERVLQKAGYHAGGLRKLEAANAIGKQFDCDLANSPSFILLRDALLDRTLP